MPRYVVTSGDQELPIAIEPRADGVTLTVKRVAHAVALDGGRRAVRSIRIGNRRVEFGWRRLEEGVYEIVIDGQPHRAQVRDELLERFARAAKRAGRDGGPAIVSAPIAGLVMKVAAKPGDRVEPGVSLLILYAMKLENNITAPLAGVVKQVHVKENEAVEKGAPLVVIEPGNPDPRPRVP